MPTRPLLACALTLATAVPSLLAASEPAETRGRSQEPAARHLTPAQHQVERAKRMTPAVRQVQRVLAEARVPFEPALLFSRNWRKRLRPALLSMPEMAEKKSNGGTLKGAVMADVLHLPERVRLLGDTVIVANRVVFEGKDTLIRGSHGLHIFSVNSISATSPGASVTIDLNGRGRREWLEERQKSAGANAAVRNRGRVGGAKMSQVSYAHAAARAQNLDGARGADGAMGATGYVGDDGTDGANGADGTCGGNLNGVAGVPGAWGKDGGRGLRGVDGGKGENGNPWTLSISGANDPMTYTITSRGGDGGNGGQGGFGGQGGRGGKGGNGGSGASCGCGMLGTGGDAGWGGDSGRGGDGGDGGDGGGGGGGGVITVIHPPGYDISKVRTDVRAGQGGAPGISGLAATSGTPGLAGRPGSGGSAFACGSSNDGSGGRNGSGGGPGEHGQPGKWGASGVNGSVNYQINDPGSGGVGGGSGSPSFEPGSFNGSCTTWYWVWYHCDCYQLTRNLVSDYFRQTSYRTFDLAGAPGPAPDNLECSCFETGRQEAGCY